MQSVVLRKEAVEGIGLAIELLVGLIVLGEFFVLLVFAAFMLTFFGLSALPLIIAVVAIVILITVFYVHSELTARRKRQEMAWNPPPSPNGSVQEYVGGPHAPMGHPPPFQGPNGPAQPFGPGYGLYATPAYARPIEAPIHTPAHFCRTCGAKMYPGDRRCPSCQTPVGRG